MKSSKFLLFLILCFVVTLPVHAQAKKITAAEAKNHVGEKSTVCGRVVGTHFASGSKGQPTFLNLDEPFPKEIFRILIWGSDRPKFGRPEETYRDKEVCVTGIITSYRGVAEIVASEPGQIQVRK
jgi:hypothetical protein